VALASQGVLVGSLGAYWAIERTMAMVWGP
jgi:hypothetical protein